MTNIEVAIKHFEQREKDFGRKVYTDEVLRTLNFLKQCEEQNLKLIGIGYKTYDGDNEYVNLKPSQMYEGGFAVEQTTK